jgi:hypothetical protein
MTAKNSLVALSSAVAISLRLSFNFVTMGSILYVQPPMLRFVDVHYLQDGSGASAPRNQIA